MATPANPSEPAETELESQGSSPAQAQSLLSGLGLTPKSSVEDFISAVQNKAKADPSGGQGILGDVSSWLTQNIADPIKQAATAPLSQSLTAGFSGSETPGATTPAKKKAAPKLESPQAAAKAATAQSPYEELANALASSYLQQVNQLEPLISGQGIYGTGGETDQAVGAASAMAPGAGGWLGQQAAAEKTASAPLQAAMGQVGNAEAAGAIPAASAIANTGLANTEYLQSAPYQQILSELANETAYRAASSGASAFGNSPLASSPLLQTIFTQLGLGGSGTAGSPTLPGAKTAAKGGTSGTASTTGTAQGNNPTG